MFKKATPEEMGLQSSEVIRFINYLNDNSLTTHSLILIRDDKIFLEAYWKPFHKDFCHRQYSQTKSFVGIAVMLLVSEGKISLDDRILDYFADKIDDIESIPERLTKQTIRQMLTMTTVGGEKWWMGESDPDRTHIYINRQKANLPGALWEYDSDGSQVLTGLVERVSGMSLLDYLCQKLFSHMGSFKNAKMLKTPNGDSWGDSALLCTARDMASFAKLLMDGGKWDGKQLMDADCVAAATTKQADNSESNFFSVFGHGYGYQIWRTPRNGFAFVGMGGQITVVLPDKRLIFVINSDTQGNASAYNLIVNGFISFIADRISDCPLQENVSDYERLEAKVNALELFALKGIKKSPFFDTVNGKKYVCQPNNLGITSFSFSFAGDEGEFRYTNDQGDKIIPFGINKNVFGLFPQLGYSDEIGREITTNGHMYRDAVSLRFTDEKKLQMRVQIIDKYFGNFHATFAFVGKEVSCRFTATAENFLKEYNGSFVACEEKPE